MAIPGICLGIFQGSHGSHRATPEPLCLLTMTQAGCEHATQCISLVHTNTLHIVLERKTYNLTKATEATKKEIELDCLPARIFFI